MQEVFEKDFIYAENLQNYSVYEDFWHFQYTVSQFKKMRKILPVSNRLATNLDFFNFFLQINQVTVSINVISNILKCVSQHSLTIIFSYTIFFAQS